MTNRRLGEVGFLFEHTNPELSIVDAFKLNLLRNSLSVLTYFALFFVGGWAITPLIFRNKDGEIVKLLAMDIYPTTIATFPLRRNNEVISYVIDYFSYDLMFLSSIMDEKRLTPHSIRTITNYVLDPELEDHIWRDIIVRKIIAHKHTPEDVYVSLADSVLEDRLIYRVQGDTVRDMVEIVCSNHSNHGLRFELMERFLAKGSPDVRTHKGMLTVGVVGHILVNTTHYPEGVLERLAEVALDNGFTKFAKIFNSIFWMTSPSFVGTPKEWVDATLSTPAAGTPEEFLRTFVHSPWARPHSKCGWTWDICRVERDREKYEQWVDDMYSKQAGNEE